MDRTVKIWNLDEMSYVETLWVMNFILNFYPCIHNSFLNLGWGIKTPSLALMLWTKREQLQQVVEIILFVYGRFQKNPSLSLTGIKDQSIASGLLTTNTLSAAEMMGIKQTI